MARKKISVIFSIYLSFSLLFLILACKKEEVVVIPPTPPSAPVFLINHTIINIGGNEYLQFVCRCHTDCIDLSTVNISNPAKQKWVYYYYSDSTDYMPFIKEESFTFPEDYKKVPGIWSFNFIGKRAIDSTSFSSTVNDTIPQ